MCSKDPFIWFPEQKSKNPHLKSTDIKWNEIKVATDNKNPDYVKLANSYNIKAIECSKQKDLESTVQYMLDCKKAIVGNFLAAKKTPRVK